MKLNIREDKALIMIYGLPVSLSHLSIPCFQQFKANLYFGQMMSGSLGLCWNLNQAKENIPGGMFLFLKVPR